MSSEFSYRDYVTDINFNESYSRYQDRYIQDARESDKVMIRLVRTIVEQQSGSGRPLSLLDIGCSTGNLLHHLKKEIPDLRLSGGDMVPSILEKCRTNPQLAGVRFETMNVLDLKCREQFDIVTINAVLYMLEEDEFDRAMQNISKALKGEGWVVAFDFFHAFNQNLAILEKSKSHPSGLMLHFRPYSRVKTVLAKAGLSHVSFQPFAIPLDLPRHVTFSSNLDGFEDLNSYTVATAGEGRLIFRGALYQPWCHLVAQKDSCPE